MYSFFLITFKWSANCFWLHMLPLISVLLKFCEYLATLLLVRCTNRLFMLSMSKSSAENLMQHSSQTQIFGGFQSCTSTQSLISNFRDFIMRGFSMYFYTTYWVSFPMMKSIIFSKFVKHLIPLPRDKSVVVKNWCYNWA